MTVVSHIFKRAVGRAVIALLVCLAVLGCVAQKKLSESQEKREAQTPNIVFIFADDLGFGDIGANGNTRFNTPNLDRLAKQGTNFQQFTVASPVCSPSRAAVLTGQFPDRHLIFQHFNTVEHHQRNGMPDWLDPKAPSIARVLQDTGYVTGHFGKWHLTNRPIPDAPEPEAYGFDHYAVFNGPGPQTDAVAVFSDALDFIDAHKDQAFFLNLWIHETHTPHYPDPAQVKAYAHMDEQAQIYAATVSSADDGVGQVMDRLDALGLRENTIIIFSSDNGPEVTADESERYLTTDPDAAVEGRDPLGRYFSVGTTAGLRGKKRDLYEGGIRVPFLVSWPGVVPQGAVDAQSVLNAVDLFPTFAGIAQAELPSGYQPDGQNVLPALRGAAFERQKPLFWQRLGPASEDGAPRQVWAAMRDGKWKYIRQVDGSVLLFNVEQDPYEEINLANDYPDIAEAMSAEFAVWQSTLPSDLPKAAISKERNSR
ncbi:sulfatase-like hydrolase/transferase [Aquisalinus flavus]|uniref:N-acetylgalactosamine-6-sulfatase n=1 Tax=Aquisalinus flavus TaxID=1526572 RepID=A0A8J2Y3Y6_9PROT|nr:sulfatase-like hydrolase/transferase [Aquisalinus flavus]MBD0425989.1 sulfatase-like hydrolase/transferase [Aquisalinus flavus]GGD11595.1 N-acetylgalactosamine-6-sulfatase [Aquisalinus flavus]